MHNQKTTLSAHCVFDRDSMVFGASISPVSSLPSADINDARISALLLVRVLLRPPALLMDCDRMRSSASIEAVECCSQSEAPVRM